MYFMSVIFYSLYSWHSSKLYYCICSLKNFIAIWYSILWCMNLFVLSPLIEIWITSRLELLKNNAVDILRFVSLCMWHAFVWYNLVFEFLFIGNIYLHFKENKELVSKVIIPIYIPTITAWVLLYNALQFHQEK